MRCIIAQSSLAWLWDTPGLWRWQWGGSIPRLDLTPRDVGMVVADVAVAMATKDALIRQGVLPPDIISKKWQVLQCSLGLVFCRYGSPGARTGRQRAVGLDRPGARPLMAHSGWLPGWRARHHPHRCEPLWTAGSGDLWTRHGRCGRWVQWFDIFPTDIYRCRRCLHQQCPSGRLFFWGFSSSATSSTVAPVSWTFSFHSWILCRRVGVSHWPLKAPSKCSTTLWATQLRSPSLNGAKLAGSASLMG